MMSTNTKRSVVFADAPAVALEILEVIGDSEAPAVPKRPRSHRRAREEPEEEEEEGELVEDEGSENSDEDEYSDDEAGSEDREDPLIEAIADILVTEDGISVAESMKAIALSVNALVQVISNATEKQGKNTKIQSKLLQIIAEAVSGSSVVPAGDHNTPEATGASTNGVDTTA
jgi:hypothetical protein